MNYAGMKPLDDSAQRQDPGLVHIEGEAVWKGSGIYATV